MLCTSMLRVAALSISSLALVPLINAPAVAATIFLPVQSSVDNSAERTGRATVGTRPRTVSQAALFPVDDDRVMWGLLAGGIALIGTVLRRKKRMPSVTS